jgi:NADH-quinone oxidoreductase subunit L
VSAAVPFAVTMVAAPAAAGLIGLLFPRNAKRPAAMLGIAGAAISLLASIGLVLSLSQSDAIDKWRTWVEFGPLKVTLGVYLTSPMADVAIAVGVVALAVQIYSVAYLDTDRRYAPYAAQISLFTAAMLMVVVSGDLIVLLVGWEVMGICSYLLIGHDRSLPEAPAAAVKAFIVTRFGDVGFMLGIALLGVSVGSFRLGRIYETVGLLSPARLTVIGFLLLLGAIGKSAQFPLHTWLPDAMAGPTPISALIHAATMVAAGVIVLARLFPIFHSSTAVITTIAVIAVVTMLLAALAATAQDDIKRVLAWSTVSQVAFMFAGFAVGFPSTALFHLLTHAAFKALLFLAAGCVIHAVGTNSMTRMGGLRRTMPVTFICMSIGLAALAGVPPFSGFFSKDAIVDQAWKVADGSERFTHVPRWVALLVLVGLLTTVVLTAWYCTRLWLRTFFGDYRGGAAGGEHPHEAPSLMRWPVIVLAVPAALLGFAGLSTTFSERLGNPGKFSLALVPAVVSVLLVALGFLSALYTWRTAPKADPARVLARSKKTVANAFYFDAVQDALVVRPVTALARLVRRGDEAVVDGAVEGVGRRTEVVGDNADTFQRGPLPRAASAVFGGAVLIALIALFVGGLR